ncbi:MAG: serine hydrolase [Planctomycetes bacterium]|nr:serine hydrolase [Planctomycetota bacterium]
MRVVPWAVLVGVASCAVPRSAESVRAADVSAFAARYAREFAIPGIWIAVVEEDPVTGRRLQWSCPVGPDEVPSADAVLRVASISKLFTATAAMALVERGLLDLDAPVSKYLPDFAPRKPYGGTVTLRTLLGHRSGLVRESPVGHYFDPSAPSLSATVASLDDTSLVFAPGREFKYSNPGFGVVGEIVARVHGTSFERAVRDLVLDPLDLRDSDFAPRPDLVARRVNGVMWTYDGRTIATPTFPFGYSPAANLLTTPADLVQFAASWFPWSKQRVLRPDTQAAMWALPPDVDNGCALGFFVGSFDGHREVGHDGAVYGAASALRALPDDGLAVAVVCAKDFSNAVAEAIAERALSVALAARRGETLPPPEFPAAVGASDARRLAGRWICGDNWVELYERDGELLYDPNIGVRTRLRRAANGELVSDDPLSLGRRSLRELPDGRMHDGVVDYVRDQQVPDAPPAELLPLLGEYGFDHDVLIVYEDHGRLAVLIEWLVRELPDPEGPDLWRFGPGIYGGDPLRFERGPDGAVIAAVVGGARFARRPGPTPGGFRIAPARPVEELFAASAGVVPPARLTAGDRAFDLVDVAPLDPTLRIDLRYASADNFLGAPVYPAGARARLQRPAAEALVRVHRRLAERGLGLLVFDAYRPWRITKVFHDAVPGPVRHFVADPAEGSRHNRGCAVDLTMFDRATGRPVAMPSDFDEFSPRAHPDYPGGTSLEREFRAILRRAMEAEGFTVNEHEWWHFDHPDWMRYPVGNEPL